ncbi:MULTISPECIES: hypothetical protein [Legionella]|uniref:Uncharacterized protein n=1 Tax=Legionella maceachernii TaxID=466 RepID=A0A0W0W008_9GAMM|nr:hypothetical protein [Legionella maceachernii]KTD25587.1 hypothetical protein Lmac_1951 [Legionella maceachernii]SJZ56900.1 hypothetical protein SAMN02745128_00438 [Legionella maceachernii]SUP00552.1 Uncharacterised protein [Legionella maceachernii]
MRTKKWLLCGTLGLSALFSSSSFAYHHTYPVVQEVRVNHYYGNPWRYPKFHRWAPPRNYVVVHNRPTHFWFRYGYW